MLGMRIAGARRPIDRLKPHQAQQTTGPVTTDAHALATLMTDHLTGAVERILQAQLIDAPHQRQGLASARKRRELHQALFPMPDPRPLNDGDSVRSLTVSTTPCSAPRQRLHQLMHQLTPCDLGRRQLALILPCSLFDVTFAAEGFKSVHVVGVLPGLAL